VIVDKGMNGGQHKARISGGRLIVNHLLNTDRHMVASKRSAQRADSLFVVSELFWGCV
jgi:hypothetical protein